jgi:hypothetical protein
MNISQFLRSRHTKTDGTLPAPGDSGKRIESTLIAEPHYTGKSDYCFHLHFVQGPTSKYEQNMRTGDIIKQISTVLALIYSLDSYAKLKVKQSHCRPGQTLTAPGG